MAAPVRGEDPIENLVWLSDSVLELRPRPESWSWSWGSAVLSYGLLRSAQVTGDGRYAEHVRRFVDAHVDEDGRVDQAILYPDTVAPGMAVLGVLRRTGDERYAIACEFLADWLLYDAPRARDGGWFHLPVTDVQFIDTLFMTTVFLAGYGEWSGRQDCVDEALRQHELLSGNMYSEVDRLYWHGWDENGLFSPWATPWRHHNTAFWARGNGWAVSSAARVLSVADPASPDFQATRDRLESVLARLEGLQDPASGHWWTVLDVPDGPFNYTETSATALIVEAWVRGAREGVVPPPPEMLVDRGFAAVQSRIVADEQGRARVTGVSIGTNPSGYWPYVLTPTWPDRPWGVGATLLLLAEVAGQ